MIAAQVLLLQPRRCVGLVTFPRVVRSIWALHFEIGVKRETRQLGTIAATSCSTTYCRQQQFLELRAASEIVPTITTERLRIVLEKMSKARLHCSLPMIGNSLQRTPLLSMHMQYSVNMCGLFVFVLFLTWPRLQLNGSFFDHDLLH